MTKVAIIGATGKEGSLILKKALDAGFDVTAIVRQASKLSVHPQHVLEKDVFDLAASDLVDFDVIVSAYAAPAGKEQLYSTLFERFTKLLANSATRLIIVGGAGSLYADESRTKKHVDIMPQDLPWIAIPREMAKASEIIKHSAINYTYFSPADVFIVEGKETGDTTITDDVFRTNAQGKSEVSYIDFAGAVIQMIREKSHQREHIGIYQN